MNRGDKGSKYAVIFLFLLNLIVGLLLINAGLFHYDSVILAQAVENLYKTGTLQPATNGRYGAVIINSILYFPFFLLGHNADFLTRFSSILFHSLSIAMLFLFIKELFGDFIMAIFASLLFSFVPFYFSPNTYGKEHGASMFFLILSFYLLQRGINRKSLFSITLASLFFVFSISIRESMLINVFLFILLYFAPCVSIRPLNIVFPEDRLKPRFLASLFIPLVLGLGLLFFTYLRYVVYKTLFIKDAGTNYFVGIFSPVLIMSLKDLKSSLPLLLIGFSLFGIIKMFFKVNLFLPLFFLFWFLLIFYFGNTSCYAARHLDIVTIPLCVFASYVLSTFYSKDKLIAISLIIYFISSMLMFMYPILIFRHRYCGEKEFALFVKEKTEDNAMIIAMDEGPFIEYYGKRRVISHPIGDSVKIEEFIDEIKEYLKNKVSVYLIESGLSYDPGEHFQKNLFENFNVSIIGEKLTEDYHIAEIKFHDYYEKLFKIELKNALPEGNVNRSVF